MRMPSEVRPTRRASSGSISCRARACRSHARSARVSVRVVGSSPLGPAKGLRTSHACRCPICDASSFMRGSTPQCTKGKRAITSAPQIMMRAGQGGRRRRTRAQERKKTLIQRSRRRDTAASIYSPPPTARYGTRESETQYARKRIKKKNSKAHRRLRASAQAEGKQECFFYQVKKRQAESRALPSPATPSAARFSVSSVQEPRPAGVSSSVVRAPQAGLSCTLLRREKDVRREEERCAASQASSSIERAT